MKIKRISSLLLCILIITAFFAASAEASLSATIENGALVARWQGVKGDCVLTFYNNDWPVRVCNVDGAAGMASLPLSSPNGHWSVRLKTPAGCLTAKVGAAVVSPAPSEKPTPVSIPAPTPIPTEVAPQPTGQRRNDLAAQVVDQVNAERAKQGLSALRVDPELTRAACVRAEEIARSFSHTRPDGTSWRTVSAAAYGENIARGQRTADKVMAAWLTSQGHRENILRASYGSIGVCAYVSNGIVHWVQLFGK